MTIVKNGVTISSVNNFVHEQILVKLHICTIENPMVNKNGIVEFLGNMKGRNDLNCKPS
ncbi:hypothetical protein D3C86_1831360 [compost metagenome]